MGRLFGTDGARGIANTELTCELAMQIGRASAMVLTKHTNRRPKILIGRDTRISSEMLEAALVAGLCSVGADAELIGVIPTPAVAYLIPKYEADAGIMISASHNPVEYNGIKLFSNTGYKLTDEIQDEIEALILDTPEKIALKSGVELGRVYKRRSAPIDYVNHLVNTMDIDLSGITVAVDCANGSASATVELLFSSLGANAKIIHSNPNGMNINEKCGSTNLESLIYFMNENNCDLGVAFDGDADRCLAVDENGNRVDGDVIMAIIAKQLKVENRLNKNTAVITVMSNFGMNEFSKKNGINLVRTSVGDRYVLEEMLNSDYNFGGEDSGHVIFKDFANTGDGQLTAIQLLRVFKMKGEPMSKLCKVMVKSPQVMKCVSATEEQKQIFNNDEVIKTAVKEVEEKLSDSGRILVRASGTEPLIRVMLEGGEYKQINEFCDKICDIIKERIS